VIDETPGARKLAPADLRVARKLGHREVFVAFPEGPAIPTNGQHCLAGSRCGLIRIHEEVVEVQGTGEAA
jgi:hypothetical protein